MKLKLLYLVQLLVVCTCFLGLTFAETVAKFNGVQSYVEKSTSELASGVFSASIWVWPERSSQAEEAILSFASSNLKTSATVGWRDQRIYYSDDTKGNVTSTLTYSRKQWHYVTVTTALSDQGVYLDASSTTVAHRSVIVYVDGVKALELATRLPDLTNAVVTLGSEFKQYKRQKFFTGLLDELRLYKKTLTSTEAADLPFSKPPTGTSIYLHFDVLSTVDLSSSTQEIEGVSYSYVETVNIDRMPYDTLTVSGVSKTSPFSNSLYTEYKGPLGGIVLTVNGANFAQTHFLKATLDSRVLDYEYTSPSELLLTLPALSLAEAGTKKIKVTNGGGNAGEFDVTLAYSVVEDLNANLIAHYNFDGNVKNVDKSLSEYDATNTNTYQGSATFTTDRNGRINQALQFSYGQRLDVPTAVGSGGASTVCMWFYAEPGAHTLYSERTQVGATKYNDLTVSADGVLHYRGISSNASIIFDSWQFVCVSNSDLTASIYKSGKMVATIPVTAVAETLTTALIASHLKGKVDDVWLWKRALTSEEVTQMYEKEQYAVELDGSHHFTLTNAANSFQSTSWHSNSEVTVEVWIKPQVITGTSRIIYQPSKKVGATGDAALGFSVSLVDGHVEFRVMLDSSITPPIFRAVATSTAVLSTGNWYLVSATYDQSSMVIAVNGVAQSIGVSSFLTGSLSVNQPYSTKMTFLTIANDPTSLDKQPLEESTKSIIVGESLKGLVGGVRLWSDDLSETQLADYHACKPSVKSHSNLYAVFPFNEGMGSELSSGSSPAIVLTFSGSNKPFWMYSDHDVPPATISWPQSPVTGSGSLSGKAGEVATFTFQGKDKCGNVLKKGGDSVQVVLAGPLDRHLYLFNGNISDNTDGTYSGSYQANHCGFYALRVEDTSVPVKDGTYLDGSYATKLAKNTPLKIFIDSAATNAALSYTYDDTDLFSTDDRETAIAGATTKFTLQAVDEYGCVKTKGGDMFDVLLNGKYTQDGRVVDLGNGKYTVEYAPLVTGKSLLSVTLDSVHVGTLKEDDPKDKKGLSLGSTSKNGKGSPFCIDAVSGSSLEFDGNNFVEVADAPAFDLADKYTIDLFVKPTQALLTAKLLSKESPISGHGYWISLSSGLVSTGVYVGADEYRFIETTYAPATNTWTHLSVVYTGFSLIVYADGVEVAKQLYEEAKAPRENSQKVIIGNGMVGLLDEVRIFNHALSLETLTSIMHCPSLSEDVVAYFRFNDKIGTTATDYSDSNVDGTLKGSPLPTWNTEEAPTHAGVLDLSSSTFEGQGLASAVVGEQTGFTSKLFDKCGFPYTTLLVNNEIPSSLIQVSFENLSQADFVMPVNNAEVLPVASANATSDSCVGTNVYDVKYTPTSCGLSNLKLKIEGQDLNPYEVSFLTNNVTDVGKTSAMFPSEVVSGIAFEIKASTLDTYGCQRIAGGDKFEIALTRISKPASEGTMHGPDTVVTKVAVVDKGDGTYEATAIAPTPGEYLLDMAVGGVKVPGSPFKIKASSAPFRKIQTEGPGERYKSILASYKGDVYVVNGWSSAEPHALQPDLYGHDDIWRYAPDIDESTWHYRKKFTFSSVPGHVVSFTVNTKELVASGKLNADCSDIFFRSVSTSSNVPYWIDPLPGCNSEKTILWLKPTEESIHMYYGNTYAKATALTSAESLMVAYDNFEGGTIGDYGYNLTSSCSDSSTDPSAFVVSSESSLSGTHSLKVNSIATAGGAIEKSINSMSKYVLKGYFYDNLESSSINWISPNYLPCTEFASKKDSLSQSYIVGINSQTSSSVYSTSYPWKMSSHARQSGWHSFEIADNGATATFSIDGIQLDSKKSKALTKIYLYTGGSVGAWDSIFVADYTPPIDVSVGQEEPVIWNGRSFFKVDTRGTSPPARRTTSFVRDGGKIYLIGGFGNYASIGSTSSVYGAIGPHAAEDKVWYLDLDKRRWEHVIPYGSLRPSAREYHSMALYNGKIYVFGGKSGSTYLSDMLEYNIDENGYSSVKAAPGPSGRFGHSAVTYGTAMYIFGGFTSAGPSSEMWMFDFKTSKWSDITPEGSPSPRYMFASAGSGESWYIYGGHTSDSVSKELYRYDFEYNIWSSLGSGEQGLANSAIAFSGNNDMYLYGGKSPSSYSSAFYQLSL